MLDLDAKEQNNPHLQTMLRVIAQTFNDKCIKNVIQCQNIYKNLPKTDKVIKFIEYFSMYDTNEKLRIAMFIQILQKFDYQSKPAS